MSPDVKWLEKALFAELYPLLRPLVRDDREVREVFGSNSSKSTKFGAHIDYTLLFQILMGAKKRVPWDHRHGDVMNGRHLEWPPPVFSKLNQALNYRIRL